MIRINGLLAAAAALMIGAGAALAQGTAQTTPPAPRAPAAATTSPTATTAAPTTRKAAKRAAKKATKVAKAPAKPRSEKSLKCSADAQAAGLKGKPRRAFMRKCNKAA